MTFGAIFSGTSGSVQIDDTYANYTLISMGTASSTGGSGLNEVDITLNGATAPILAWNSGSNFIIRRQVVRSGSTTTWKLLCLGSFTFTYYIFDTAAALTSSSGFGLIIRDPSGNITFDYNRKWARVAGVLSTTTLKATKTVNFQDWSLTPGIVYAVCPAINLLALGVSHTTSGSINTITNYYAYSMWAADTGAAHFTGYNYRAQNYTRSTLDDPPGDGLYQNNTSAVLFDVTNY